MKVFQSDHCLFCSGAHDSASCSVYPTTETRMNLLEERNACLRCLHTGHTSLDCLNWSPCKRCGRCSHNTALCIRNKLRASRPKKEICVFCTTHNNSNSCRSASTFASRTKILQKRNRCVRCLEYHHGQPCEAPLVQCVYCKQFDHHQAMCPKNCNLKENFEPNPSKLDCLFCGTHKHTARCPQVVNLQQRRDILDTQGRCHKCLRLHRTEDCLSQYRCFVCVSTQHHEALCPKNPKIIVDKATEINLASDTDTVSTKSLQTLPLLPKPATRQTFFDFVMEIKLPNGPFCFDV